MPTRNTNTATQDSGGNNRTATHLATNIVIKCNGNVIGALQKVSVGEKRSIRMIDEIGNDGHIDSAPEKSTDYSISCERIRFDRLRAPEAFSRGYVHVKSQRIPFDLEIQDIFADADEGNAVVTVLKNCWIESIDVDYNATDWIIAERMSLTCEDIFSTVNNQNVAQLIPNGYQNPSYFNKYEREADRGMFSGALDAAGVLNAFLVDPAS